MRSLQKERENIVSVVVILLIAYAIGEFLRECERLEREWHALGEGTTLADRRGRWADVNL
jgi:hypothetical protein